MHCSLIRIHCSSSTILHLVWSIIQVLTPGIWGPCLTPHWLSNSHQARLWSSLISHRKCGQLMLSTTTCTLNAEFLNLLMTSLYWWSKAAMQTKQSDLLVIIWQVVTTQTGHTWWGIWRTIKRLLLVKNSCRIWVKSTITMGHTVQEVFCRLEYYSPVKRKTII